MLVYSCQEGISIKNNSHVFLRRHQFGRSHTQTWHSCPTVRHPASLGKLLPRGTQQSNEQEHQALHRIDATVRSCKVQSLPRSRRLHTYVSTALAIPTRRLIRDRCNTAPNRTQLLYQGLFLISALTPPLGRLSKQCPGLDVAQELRQALPLPGSSCRHRHRTIQNQRQ